MKHPCSRLSRVLAEAVGFRDIDIVNIRRGIQPLFDRVINQDENCTEVPAKKSKDNKKERLERQHNDRDHQKNRSEGPSKGREGKETNEAAQEDIIRSESQEILTKDINNRAPNNIKRAQHHKSRWYHKNRSRRRQKGRQHYQTRTKNRQRYRDRLL
jgi:hypothetical protein